MPIQDDFAYTLQTTYETSSILIGLHRRATNGIMMLSADVFVVKMLTLSKYSLMAKLNICLCIAHWCRMEKLSHVAQG